MDPRIIKSITEQIHRRFPEFAGCQPRVRLQQPSQTGGPLPKGRSSTYLLTFHSTPKAAAGSSRAMPRWVRVVVSETGKILKVTTSR
jgi:hypothetical protein